MPPSPKAAGRSWAARRSGATFKLVVPNPNKNAGGLAAMIAAAGEYYGRTDIGVEDLTNPEFQAWLEELMGAVTDFSSASAYTAEDFALFGYSVGDGGQLLESDLLQNMQGILTRWDDPLSIYYPQYVTWFDFPFTVWVGPETSALEKNAALEFQRFLLDQAQQEGRVILRPASRQSQRAGGCHGRELVRQVAGSRCGVHRSPQRCDAQPKSRGLAHPAALVRIKCGQLRQRIGRG